MKVAGRKNQGAWYRANKFIKGQSTESATALSMAIEGSAFISAAHIAMLDLAAESGATVSDAADSLTEWAYQLGTIGIPWQVWSGRLSFTTYTPLTGEDEGTYVANYQSAFHYFGKDLRKIVTRFMLGQRAVRDLENVKRRNQGNPGGRADATKVDV